MPLGRRLDSAPDCMCVVCAVRCATHWYGTKVPGVRIGVAVCDVCGYRSHSVPLPVSDVRRLRPSHLPDRDFLWEVSRINAGDSKTDGRQATIKDMTLYFGAPRVIVLGKISTLLKKGRITGCDCGCNTGMELTDAGRRYLTEMVSAA